jgi:hypothetical protein
MGDFLGGLLSGVGKGLLDRERKQHDDKIRDNESRQRILESVMNNPDTRPEDKQAILKILITPSDQGSGKGKGKKQASNPLHDFIDKVGGMMGGATGSASSNSSGTVPTKGPGGYSGPDVLPASNDDIAGGPTPRGGGPVPDPAQKPLSVPQMPSGASASPANGKPAGANGQGLSVPPMPQKGIFKSQQEKDQEQIDREKNFYEQVTKPEKEADQKALQDREDKLIQAGHDREDAKEKAQQLRDDARQRALDTRMKSQQGFQERMEEMRARSAENRDRIRSAEQFKLTDSKTYAAMGKQNQAERQKSVSETLKSLQQQITTSTGVMKSRESEASKQPSYEFWKNAPDTKSAKEDIENANAAYQFLTDHKTAVIEGKEDMDDITEKTEDIVRNGVPIQSKAEWVKNNPDRKDADQVMQKLARTGVKVVP